MPLPTPELRPLGALFDDLPDLLRGCMLAVVPTSCDPAEEPEAARAVLTDDELRSARTWRSADRRRHFLAGRAAAHAAGAALLGHPATLRFTNAGAPRLALSPGRDAPLSITHSGDLACACAAPPGWLLGIDYEVGAADRPHLARTVCGPDEQRWIQRQPAPEAAFAQLWTLKEAVLKAFEVGLVADLPALQLLGITGQRATFQALKPLHPTLPHPLPSALIARVTQLQGHPLALVALAPAPQAENPR